MLYDNAQLLLILNKFYLITNKIAYKKKATEIANWIMTEMQDKNGGYYSALDADSDGVEDKYYVWSYNELKTILKNDFEFFSKVFDIKSEGNWEGNIVLSRYDNLHIKKEDEEKVQLLLNKLKLSRQQRVRPQLDNKILADWNGLTIEAMAYSAKILNDKKYLNSAEHAFLFIF